MVKIKINSTSIFIPSILSIILHITLFFWVSGLEGFAFPYPNPERVLYISIKEKLPLKHNITMAKGGPFLESSFEKGDVKVTSKENQNDNQKENKEEQIVKEEQYKEIAVDKEEVSKDAMVDIKSKNTEINNYESKADREPFQLSRSVNEKLYFNIYWLGIYVGKAELEAINNNGKLKITSQVHSAPFISAFYKVEDYAESLIMDGMPVNFRIKQHEGKYRSNKETIFYMSDRKVTFFNYLNGTKNEYITMMDGVVWDVLSGFYYLRTQPLEIGKTVYIDIFDSNKFLKAVINVLKKEKIDIPNRGEVGTIIVKPELKSEGLFQRKGDILIWLTDDDKKIPVKVETKVPVGDIVAELVDFKIE